MLKLDDVTLVLVSTINIDRCIKALRYSMKGVKFSKVLFITDRTQNLKDIDIIYTMPLDYIGYSKFIVYHLHNYITTKHALIIQDDGFVVNPDKWDNKFLEYDYIGAPFPIPKITDKISYRNPFGELIRVGNGGFSLRSKKILSLASELELEWKGYFGYHNEDGFYAVHNRHIYEENGCVYAPIDIAAKFSIEMDTPETIGIEPFGFHGKDNKYYNLI
jgi:hypothetical protein